MTSELATKYDPKPIEKRMYDKWLNGGYFHAQPDQARRPFTIMIPPPNVTGVLHLGHAINNTLQDILIRRKRMQGFEALWMPGSDHAGIATQAVVERNIREQEGKTRHDLGREKLVERIWQWKEDYGSRIINQLKSLGCSCDWDRTRFTLDEVCEAAVRETFFRLFRDGLIYRGLRLVNWDTQIQTAVADDEVYHEKVKGSLWHLRYPIEGRDAAAANAQAGRDYFMVATTRPETMLGDTAVAVHPEDPRYKHLIGQRCVLPLMDRPIPIIGDGELVDMEFGTGAVKVTPAHDPNDYACAQRNDLEMINILTPDGKINDNGGAYVGMDRFAARKKVVEDLEAAGLLEKIEPYETEIGHSDRSKSPIEPYLSEQWFVRMGDLDQGRTVPREVPDGAPGLAQLAIDAVQDGRVTFHPSRYAKTYLDWLSEKRDWCISRQLWWGHRIPVWTFEFDNPSPGATYQAGTQSSDQVDPALGDVLHNAIGGDLDKMITGTDTRGNPLQYFLRIEPIEGQDHRLRAYLCLNQPCPDVEQRIEQAGFVQDPDVLDTWFSSALWPHSTLGWPSDTPELNYFYPTSVLATARDIITLWVARMVLTGLYNMGPRFHAAGADWKHAIPFSDVYIHTVIQDGQGRRMSKSAGNGVDPLDIIDMYGTDACRYTLGAMATETQDVRMPVKAITTDDGRTVNTSDRFDLGRNFANKLWNASRFVLMNLDGGAEPQPLNVADLPVEDRWILSRLADTIAAVDQCLDEYHFSEYVNTVYRFFWNEYCDWYLEMAKPRLQDAATADTARQVLAWCLDQVLRLLHPLMPFATEAIWESLNASVPSRGIESPSTHSDALIVAAWPTILAQWRDESIEQRFALFQDVIRAVRDTLADINRIRSAQGDAPVSDLQVYVIVTDSGDRDWLGQARSQVTRLTSVDDLHIVAGDDDLPQPSTRKRIGSADIVVPLAGVVDIDAEIARLDKQLAEVDKHLATVDKKLANSNFVDKAPAEVVQQQRDRREQLAQERDVIEQTIASLRQG